jgi:hypothetical protein
MGYTVASVYMVFENMDDLNTQIQTRTTEKILQDITTMLTTPCHITSTLTYD